MLDLSNNMGGDVWMAEGGTDLLSAHRWKSLRNFGFGLLALAAIAGLTIYLATILGGKDKDDIEWIDALVGKFKDLDVHKVLAVSRSGFTRAALKKARISQRTEWTGLRDPIVITPLAMQIVANR